MRSTVSFIACVSSLRCFSECFIFLGDQVPGVLAPRLQRYVTNMVVSIISAGPDGPSDDREENVEDVRFKRKAYLSLMNTSLKKKVEDHIEMEVLEAYFNG